MRYQVAQNRIVADHGLGAHWVGGGPVGQAIFTATPIQTKIGPSAAGGCPPPGYPQYTQDNGAGNCCVPSSCIPVRLAAGPGEGGGGTKGGCGPGETDLGPAPGGRRWCGGPVVVKPSTPPPQPKSAEKTETINCGWDVSRTPGGATAGYRGAPVAIICTHDGSLESKDRCCSNYTGFPGKAQYVDY